MDMNVDMGAEAVVTYGEQDVVRVLIGDTTSPVYSTGEAES
jgi:hypothetical protein